MEYASTVALPRSIDEYLHLVSQVLAPDVSYRDPVHSLTGRDAVIDMLRRFIGRLDRSSVRFELIADLPAAAVWRWQLRLTPRFLPRLFIIDGLVHARVVDGLIVEQREYYDPMQSVHDVPVVGPLFGGILRRA